MKKKVFLTFLIALFVVNVLAQGFFWRSLVFGVSGVNMRIALGVYDAYFYAYSARHILRAIFFLTCLSTETSRRTAKYIWPLGIYVAMYVAPFFISPLEERYVAVFLMAFLPLLIALFDLPQYRLENPTKRSKEGIALACEGLELPVNIPEEGIMILGAPGSGKTYYATEPLIEKFIERGDAGLIYDYDFPREAGETRSLTQFAYNALKKSGRDTPFYSINFSDVNYSYRMNPIAPETIEDRAQLRQISKVFFENLSPGMAKGDFWGQASTSVFEALAIALQRKAPNCCTIPHLMSILGHETDKVVKFIRSDEVAQTRIRSLLEAQKDAPETFRGVLTNLTTKLSSIANKKVMYVLSGHTVPTNLKKEGAIVSIGNVPRQKEAFSPLIAVMMTSLMKGFYHHGGSKAFLAIDEAPTLYLPYLPEVPATVRKYGVSTIVALQSNSQLDNTYGARKSSALRESLKNKLVCASEDASAEYASKLMGTVKKKDGNRNIEKRIFSPQDIATLAKGEFVGKVSGSNRTYFHAKLKPSQLKTEEKLPKVTNVNLNKWEEKIMQEAGEVLV